MLDATTKFHTQKGVRVSVSMYEYGSLQQLFTVYTVIASNFLDLYGTATIQ